MRFVWPHRRSFDRNNQPFRCCDKKEKFLSLRVVHERRYDIGRDILSATHLFINSMHKPKRLE